MSGYSRIVVKVGSSLVASTGSGIDRAFVADLVAQLADLRRGGADVLLVTSGAVAAGVEALGLPERPAEMPALQAAAAVGQARLIAAYAEEFGKHGLVVGQVLVTRHDTAHRRQYLHATDTLERLLGMGVVPVVNENDTTAVDELRMGDNDTLAALVAVMAHADLVVLLTDTEGLYTADPRTNEGADLLERVETLTGEMLAGAGGPGSTVGSGGMLTKVEAARMLMKAGIPMVLCYGRRPDAVRCAARGESVGTFFAGGEGELKSRKLWIALAHTPAGEITIDDGAVEALRARGKSLLPAGVTGVSGKFVPGDAVVLKSPSGETIARGITGMSSADVGLVAGMRTSEIPKVLPGYGGEEVIHRDHLVIL